MKFIVKIFFTWITMLSGMLMISPLAYAVFPDITGTYSGQITTTDFGCGTAFPGGPPNTGPFVENDTFTLTLSNQVGASFTGVASDGIGTTTFTGTVDMTGNITGSFSSVEPGSTASGSFAGTIINGTLNFTSSGSDTSGSPQCFSNSTASLTLTGGNVIAPEVTASSTVTDAVLFNTQIQGTISSVSSHISGALSGIGFSGGPRVTDNQLIIEGATGLNAGDGFAIPYGVWGSYSYTDYENDLSSTAFDGTGHGFLGGIDFGFWDNTILGVAIGYDKGNIDTTFNSGNQETDTYTIAPYFGALLTDSMSVDFTVGYSKVDYDQFRIAPGATTKITSSPVAGRRFGALNLNGFTYYDHWIIGGRVGASFASSTIESYTESNGTVVANSRTKVGTMSIAGDIAYSYQDYEPFVNLSYQNDFSLREITVTTGPQPSNDNDDILMTTGVRYFNKNGITGNLEYSKRFLRKNFNEDRISMTIRADF
jgi:autotransporter-like protein